MLRRICHKSAFFKLACSKLIIDCSEKLYAKVIIVYIFNSTSKSLSLCFNLPGSFLKVHLWLHPTLLTSILRREPTNKKSLKCLSIFSSYWPTRDWLRRSTRNSNPVMILYTGGAKGCLDHRFRAPLTYTAQLLTLRQHRPSNQYSTANQI